MSSFTVSREKIPRTGGISLQNPVVETEGGTN